MINGALYLDENLASSIALKFADHMRQLINDLRLQMIHVMRPDIKPHSVGCGWVRRTWEKGVLEEGMSMISRMLKTENIQFPFSGPPKVMMGDRDKETLAELTDNAYDLFIEGDQDISGLKAFRKRISSRLYTKAPCPILIARNQIKRNRTVMLAEAGTNIQRLADQFGRIIKTSKLSVDLIYFKAPKIIDWERHMSAVAFAEAGEFETAKEILQKNEAAPPAFSDSETIAALDKIKVNDTRFINGPPEKLALLLQDYDLVASSFPSSTSTHLEALASTDASVMLFK
ncbi:hypothetical protein ACFLZ5_10530 [Thermodesulfobacteriota bacterium]